MKRHRRSTDSGKTMAIGVSIVVLVVALVGLRWYYDKPAPQQIAMGGETRVPLAADQFTGLAQEGYAAAAEYPQLMDAIYCYCYCQENLGHKSLLSCFADQHAAGCGICLQEAVVAKLSADDGLSTLQIRQRIDKRFGS